MEQRSSQLIFPCLGPCPTFGLICHFNQMGQWGKILMISPLFWDYLFLRTEVSSYECLLQSMVVRGCCLFVLVALLGSHISSSSIHFTVRHAP